MTDIVDELLRTDLSGESLYAAARRGANEIARLRKEVRACRGALEAYEEWSLDHRAEIAGLKADHARVEQAYAEEQKRLREQVERLTVERSAIDARISELLIDGILACQLGR